MYIEYVTVDDSKVLHQMRAVEEGSTRNDTFDNAVRRLQATGFTLTGRMRNLEWSDGKTDAHIHFGSLADVRKTIIRNIHEYSFLD